MMYSEQIEYTSLSLVCAKNLYIRERKIKKLRRRRERTKKKKCIEKKRSAKINSCSKKNNRKKCKAIYEYVKILYLERIELQVGKKQAAENSNGKIEI